MRRLGLGHQADTRAARWKLWRCRSRLELGQRAVIAMTTASADIRAYVLRAYVHGAVEIHSIMRHMRTDEIAALCS